MVINLIYCDLPNAKAVSEESEDVDTHNIYINKNLPHERMREEIKGYRTKSVAILVPKIGK